MTSTGQEAGIDLDTGTITLPGPRVKNRRGHVLHLPKIALDILRSVPRRAGTDFVFDTGGGGFRSWGINTAKLRERMATVKTIPRWTLHDLRRTMRTGLGRLGVEPHIAELVIGHAKKGIVGDL
jgi:integrase